MQILSAFLIPIVIGGLVIAALALIVFFARRWRTCAPNLVLVVYGRKRKVEIQTETGPQTVIRGYRYITGGGTFVWPIVERVLEIPLNTFQVPFTTAKTPNINGVLVNVEAVANMKISSEPALLNAAVERLLETPEHDLRDLCTKTLEGQLRQIVGTLTVEEIVKEREKISQQAMAVSQNELNKLGFHVDNFVITKITDDEGYIEALGKKRTAEVIRDATIGEAEAKRDADVKSAEAKRIGETAKAEAEQAISNASRNKDLQIAENEAKVKAAQSRIPIIAGIAAQEAQKDLETKTVEAKKARVTAEIDLQKQEKERMAAQLDATIVTEADKKREARIIVADAEQKAAVMEGEALRVRQEKDGQGKQAFLTAEADGRKKAAEALLKEKEAEAGGKQAILLADAEGKRKMLLAEAEGREAQGKAEGVAVESKLVAEATGFLKKNEALAKLTEGAKTIMVLQLLPQIIEEFGEAGEKIAGAIFENIGLGLSKIDEIKIIDLGGGNNADGNPLARFAGAIPQVAFSTLTKLKELGINVEDIAKKAGIDVSKLLGSVKLTEAEPEADDQQPHGRK